MILRELLDRVLNYRVGKSGYIGVLKLDGTVLLSPSYRELEGRNIYRDKDFNLDSLSLKILSDFINIANSKPNGEFYKYYWLNPKISKTAEKLAYIEVLKDWNWAVIGTLYYDDYEKFLSDKRVELESKIESNLKSVILIISLFLLFSILISILFIRWIDRAFKSYRVKIEDKNRELEELNRDLERRVQEEIAKQEEKDRVLREQRRVLKMGAVISSVAHHWRQPLNILSLIAQKLKLAKKRKNLTNELIDKNLDKMIEIVESMSNTIESFRTFFATGEKLTKFDIVDVIKESLKFLEEDLRESRIEIKFNFDENIEMLGYPNELKQVILNIVKNSKDAILNQKDIEVKAIYITLLREKDRVVIQIVDTGGGIESENLDRVFEPYFTTREQNKGLGLYISKLLIKESMNGEMRVENVDSVDFKGTKILIELKLNIG